MRRYTPRQFIAALEALHVRPFLEVRGNRFGWGYRIEPTYDHPAIGQGINRAIARYGMTPERRLALCDELLWSGRLRA